MADHDVPAPLLQNLLQTTDLHHPPSDGPACPPPRVAIVGGSMGGCCAAIALATLDASWPAAAHYAVLVFMGLTVATWNGLWLAEIAAMAPDNVSEATASATFFVFGTYMVTPPLMGLVIKTWGYRPAFLLAAAFVAAALAILSLAPRRAP